jgi:hypothetical protein
MAPIALPLCTKSQGAGGRDWLFDQHVLIDLHRHRTDISDSRKRDLGPISGQLRLSGNRSDYSAIPNSPFKFGSVINTAIDVHFSRKGR